MCCLFFIFPYKAKGKTFEFHRGRGTEKRKRENRDCLYTFVGAEERELREVVFKSVPLFHYFSNNIFQVF